MKKLFLLIVLFAFMCGYTLLAQTRAITGSVTSSVEGEGAIPGVTVSVKGTTVGAITDANGKFSIVMPANATTLVFSYIGMKTKEIVVGTESTINVNLEADLLNLDEVIVIAYGTQKREAKTGSVGVVNNDRIRDIPETSIDKMLSGKVAGVQITSTSGQPGSDSQIRIRGISSILAGTDPLFVIDGVAVMTGNQSFYTNTGNALSALNPNDIESVTILKDAAASSIYGSRAANGVVLITTKSGKSGATKVSFRTSYGVEQLANDRGYRPLNGEEFLTLTRQSIINAGGNPDDNSTGNKKYYFPLSYRDSTQTDWLKTVTRTGKIYTAELNVEGGNDKTSNFFSMLYEKHEGIVYGSDFKKISFRSNIDHKINDKLKLGTRITGAHTIANDVPMQNMYYANPLFAAMLIQPFRKVQNADGTYNLDIPENANTNPAATAKYDTQWEKQYKVNGNVYLQWDILEGLTARTTNNIELTDGEGNRYWNPLANFGTDLGTLQTSRTQYLQLTTSNTLTFNKQFGFHSVSVIAGQEATKYSDIEYSIYSPDIDPNIPFPNSATSLNDDADYFETGYTMLSYFGVANYNFNNKYYLQGSLRTDGSSRFGSKNRWGTFWSVGASWNINKESFMENINFINMMKLRASYGLSGNFNIGNYDQYGLYSNIQYDGTSGMSPSQPANADLGWENNEEYNVGLDFAFFDRFTGSFDIYSRKTLDMLLQYPLSRTSGFTSIQTNIGSVKNSGVEFLIDASIIKNRDFQWNAGFNISHNNSEILNLGKDEQFVPTSNNRLVHKVGEHLYSFYLYDYAGVNPANGDALWRTKEGELTNKYADANRIIAGSPEPKFTGGFNTKVSYIGLSLDINLEYKWGNLVSIEENRYVNSDGYSWGNNSANTQLDYWQNPGDISRNPKPIANNSTSSSGYRSTRWLYDGSYLRIKNISISYMLPNAILSKIKVKSLRVYASAVNLYTFNKVDYFDPERGVDGSGFGIYPQTKKIMGGIELSF
jgi:TonB-dependent starch-binding outer membrane protein SusC